MHPRWPRLNAERVETASEGFVAVGHAGEACLRQLPKLDFHFVSLVFGEVMIFRFRICRNCDLADNAQGWVTASSELQARELIHGEVFLQKMPSTRESSLPDGMVIVTDGKLN